MTSVMKKIADIELPDDFQVVRIEEGYVESIRPDGLRVFVDRANDPISVRLNQVRLYGSAEAVIKSVGAIVGIRAAINYSRRYCDELLPMLEADLAQALNNIKAIKA
jgi:hypothetical protein